MFIFEFMKSNITQRYGILYKIGLPIQALINIIVFQKAAESSVKRAVLCQITRLLQMIATIPTWNSL